MLKEKIRALAAQLLPAAISMRQHLHRHPELSFEEINTALFVADRLKAIGIPFRTMAKTGIVALLKGEKGPSDKVIALRADMDALPIQEENDLPFRSVHPGVMHACGHDVHTVSLLTTAAILHHLRHEFSGTVKFIFQPGEETIPGGASIMIREGVLEDPRPMSILGQHVMPELPAGKAGFRPGKYMASADEIYITITGKGGHAAMPHLGVDPVVIASHMIVALQQVVSRKANATVPSILSFGKFIANGSHNVLPDKVMLEGTFRTMDETWREQAIHIIREMIHAVVTGMGGTCDLRISRGYPVLINHEARTAWLRQQACAYLGDENVVDLDLWMASEDFASFSQRVDACFYRLGVGNISKGITSGLHTSTFNADDQSLETGAGLMAWLTIQELEGV
jgi:amidohydrolase